MFFVSRRVWTTEEDSAIRTLVKTHGMRSWAIIEEYLASEFSIFGRSGKQCRERWHNHLGKQFALMGLRSSTVRVRSLAINSSVG